MKVLVQSLSVLAPLFVLSACGGSASLTDTTPSEPKVIEASLTAKSGSQLSGKATFTEIPDGVRVKVEVAGAPPGQVATHVHETGDCSAPDAMSAGGHFNPDSHPHGLPPATERHLGDLGNIEIKSDGTGSTEIEVKGASLQEGGSNSYFGRAIIVHEKLDDGGQPTGNAGGRIGCAVIR